MMKGQSARDRIEYLFNKCLKEQLTSDERAELDTFLQDKVYSDNVRKYMLQSFHQEKALTDMPVRQQELVWESIKILREPAEEQTKVRKIVYWKWTAIAAILLLTLTPLWIYIPNNPLSYVFVKQDTVPSPPDTAHSLVSADKQPATEQAILTTFDGNVFQLEQLQVGRFIDVGGLEMTKKGTGDLEIRFKEHSGTERRIASGINTIVTPRGGVYHIVLSDGSKVTLNASSKLSFPTSFAANERRVSFEGEGYFDIAKDRTRQFIVQTSKGKQKQEVTVYGTQFNINAYPEISGITTTLVEGSVKVSQDGNEQLLQPMQQAVAKDGQIEVSAADLNVNLAWKNNMFYFIDEPLVQVMEQISRWYDIDIRYEGEVPSLRLWGQVSRTKKMSEMLEILTQTNDIEFEIKGKEVVVKSKYRTNKLPNPIIN